VKPVHVGTKGPVWLTAFGLGCASLLAMSEALADSSRAPAATAGASPNGEYVVRVVPGTPPATYSTATWYRHIGKDFKRFQTIALLHPVAPGIIRVADNGALVTVDNWGQSGRGVVLTIHSNRGKLLRSYTLTDLYTASQISKFKHSVSNIRWRHHQIPETFFGENKVYVTDCTQGSIVVDTETGAIERFEQGAGSCE
jgi:hypothetical protein